MDTSRDISTAEMLLQVMEFTSLGASSRQQISRQLRRAHPLARLDRRIGGVLRVLVAEGLIDESDEGGEIVYRTTHDGLATLEHNGRYSGTATVLFTDIAGSTELIDRVGEAGAHEIRQRHFALLRGAIAGAGGREVKNLGDGLMVIFGATSAALECGAEMQSEVAGDDDRLGLRIGIHSGEVLRDGNDFFGSTVIIARRLCDRAEPGQTLVSAEARDIVEGSPDAVFESLGPLTMKGLTTPVEASVLVRGKATASLVG